MQTPYHFEAASPPRLTEALLRRELEHRRARRQALALWAAAWISILAAAALGAWLLPRRPAAGLVFLSFAGLSLLSCAAGGAVIYRKRKELFFL